jgi:hypothetical protein
MSMNGFFQAFPSTAIRAFGQNPQLIEPNVWGGKRAALATDVESAWDGLTALTGDIGLRAGTLVDDVLSNGCILLSEAEVKAQAQRITAFTHDMLLQKLQALDAEAALYHMEAYQEEPEDLLEQFDKLRDFYQQAAGRSLGAVVYVA